MMQTPDIALFHGFYGHRNGNWFSWFRDTMREHEKTVFCPDLPHSDTPVLDEHLELIRKKCQFTPDSIIIGHSLGGLTAIHAVLDQSVKIRRLILVAPVAPDIPSISEEVFPDEFFAYRDTPMDTGRIYSLVGSVVLFLSHNDPYIDLVPTREYYQSVFPDTLEIREYESAGHFNAPAWYREFPDILPFIFPS